MRIAPLAAPFLDQAAALLIDHFDDRGCWRELAHARAEVARVLADGFAFGAIVDDTLAGWVGGLEEYEGRVWELHPLVVHRDHRLHGVGRELVLAMEDEARRRGGLTVMLGTDDDAGMTSLSDVDLYTDTPAHLAAVRDLGRRHPFAFYQRLGYVVTGVVPDANGPGRPDILMSKSVRR